MLFNSYIFIFLFLPLALIGFYILQNRQATLAKVWLTCFSLWFYGYFNVYYLLIMIFSIAGNYVIHYAIVRARKHVYETSCKEVKPNTCRECGKILSNKLGRNIMIAGVILNVLVLFYFKYYDFFVENINTILGSNILLKKIMLPLGISFFTFQQISFLVDTYRGELEQYGVDTIEQNSDTIRKKYASVSFVDYALFVSFFPQLIAGPIVVHEEMMPQFARIGKDSRDREEKIRVFVIGVYVFVLGLAKKVLLADTFGMAVDLAYNNIDNINGFESLITILFYSLQLYFDFSGYCDMAKGIAGMFGMKIANNFNSPYKAINIVDFWKRWHITLSRFFTKNIYIPLGGNRKGEGRMYLNYLIVFFLSGLWHGAGWNFIFWGMMHGVLYIATKWWMIHKKTDVTKCEVNANRLSEWKQGIGNGIKIIATFVFVSIAWVYFRATSVGEANGLLLNIFTKSWTLPGSGFTDVFNLGEFWYVLKIMNLDSLPFSGYYIMILFSFISLLIIFKGENVDELAAKFKPTMINAILTAALFLWCVVSLSGVSTFLYFNF